MAAGRRPAPWLDYIRPALPARISRFDTYAFTAQESFIMASWNTFKNRLCIALLLGAASIQAAVAGPVLSMTATPNPALVGSTIDVDVSIADIVGLYGYQFTLSFNPALLQATGNSEGLFLATGGETYYDGGTVDNGLGTISFAFNTLLSDAPGASGSGNLAHYSFSVIGAGASVLSFSDVSFIGHNFNDLAPLANSLLVQTVDGADVPEPAGYMLLGVGLVGLMATRRRKDV
jgi:hypothetical protein